jgi:hypothetical protein
MFHNIYLLSSLILQIKNHPLDIKEISLKKILKNEYFINIFSID